MRKHKLRVTKTTIIITSLHIYVKIQMCSTHAWKSLICLPPSVGAQISSPRVACETAKGTTPSITIVRIIEEIDRKLILGFDATSSGPRLHLPFRTMIVDSCTPFAMSLAMGHLECTMRIYREILTKLESCMRARASSACVFSLFLNKCFFDVF